MRRLLPILLALLGLAAGLGAGFLLRPPAPEPVAEAPGGILPPPNLSAPPPGTEVLRLPNQFLIPLIGEGRVRAMVVVSVALEVLPGHGIDLPRHEARLRSIFLQLLFDYANLGGFDGVFTSGEQLLTLRRTLSEAARQELGDKVHDILITELLRQES
jgi:flagellar protein FliL